MELGKKYRVMTATEHGLGIVAESPISLESARETIEKLAIHYTKMVELTIFSDGNEEVVRVEARMAEEGMNGEIFVGVLDREYGGKWSCKKGADQKLVCEGLPKAA